MLYLNDHIQDFDFEAALPLLSEQRREYALKFRHLSGRRTCAAAYLLLCKGLRREYGIDELPVFGYGEHGKPFIIGHPDIHFNLSHCREAAICVLSDRPVGVDIESSRSVTDGLLRYTMNNDEQREIAASPRPDLAFLRFWTMKEAVLKCTGEGLNNDLKTALDGVATVPGSQGISGIASLTTVVAPDERYVYSVCHAAVETADTRA